MRSGRRAPVDPTVIPGLAAAPLTRGPRRFIGLGLRAQGLGARRSAPSAFAAWLGRLAAANSGFWSVVFGACQTPEAALKGWPAAEGCLTPPFGHPSPSAMERGQCAGLHLLT
jgi:hypothetical protein